MMNRKKFLQNIFGAAVIAAIPKPVFDAIVAQSVSPAVNGTAPIFTKECLDPLPLFYVFDDQKLIGGCSFFSLTFEQNFISIPKGSMKRMHDKENHHYFWIWVPDSSGYLDKVAGLKSWKVSTEHMNWLVDPKQVIEEDKKLNCLMFKDNIKISGEVYLTGCNVSVSMLEDLDYSAEFVGSGELIANPL